MCELRGKAWSCLPSLLAPPFLLQSLQDLFLTKTTQNSGDFVEAAERGSSGASYGTFAVFGLRQYKEGLRTEPPFRPVDPEHVLRDIQTDRGNWHVAAPSCDSVQRSPYGDSRRERANHYSMTSA